MKHFFYKHANIFFCISGIILFLVGVYANNYDHRIISYNLMMIFNFSIHAFGGIIFGKLITRLYKITTLDYLTGLKNRKAFVNQLNMEISKSKKKNTKLSLFMIDIDKFKNINDTYGHPIGDDVIIKVADILKQETRKTDTVTRIGGEEFAIILPNTCLDEAYNIAVRIKNKVANEQFVSDENHFKVTISIGVSVTKEDYTEEQLIKLADDALYKAKETRNEVVTI